MVAGVVPATAMGVPMGLPAIVLFILVHELP
jgi:hypothetical protein